MTTTTGNTEPTMIQIPRDFVDDLVTRAAKQPPWWQSPLLVAIATGLTAIVSTLVSNQANRQTQTDMKRLEQNLAADAELSQTRRETVDKTMGILDRLMKGADDRVLLAAKFYRKQPTIDALMNASNAVDSDWNSQHDGFTLLYLSYFKPDIGNIAWPSDSGTVLKYWDCAEANYEQYHKTGEAQRLDACKQEKGKATAAIGHLEHIIAADFQSRLSGR